MKITINPAVIAALGQQAPAKYVDPDAAALLQFKDAIPLTVKDQNGVHVQFVDIYHLHKVLDIATAPRTWFRRVVDMYGFVEGEDYITTYIDISTPEGRAQLKSGATCNYFMTSDMAKEVCMVQKTPIGREVRKYFLIAERVAKKHAAKEFADALGEKKRELAHSHQKFLQADAIATQAAKAAGYKSGTHALIDAQRDEKIARLKDSAVAHEGAALFMWEQITSAALSASQGRTAQALEALAAVTDKYGPYSDMVRDEPPWSAD